MQGCDTLKSAAVPTDTRDISRRARAGQEGVPVPPDMDALSDFQVLTSYL